MSETNVQLFPGVFRSVQGGANPDFFLHSAGRVGIGNQAPATPPAWDANTTFKLNVTGHTHVNGNLDVSGSLYGDGSNMTGVALPWVQSAPNVATDIKYEGGNVGIGGAASSTNELKVHGTVEATDLTVSGNVGIGTTNADKAKLQINNTLALLNPSYKTHSNDDQLAGKIEFYLGGSAHELSTPVAGIEGYDKYAGGSFEGALAFKVNGGEKMRIHSNGNVGIGGAVSTEKLKVYGDILATANVTAYSDKRLKSDIVKIKDALNKIDKLNGYTYTMNDKRSTGLIAQEVLEVLPEAVEGSEETTYALAYGNLASIFVEAIKELREKVLELENKIQN